MAQLVSKTGTFPKVSEVETGMFPVGWLSPRNSGKSNDGATGAVKKTDGVAMPRAVLTVVVPRARAILPNKAKDGDIAMERHRGANKLDFLGNKASEQFSRCFNEVSVRMDKARETRPAIGLPHRSRSTPLCTTE